MRIITIAVIFVIVNNCYSQSNYCIPSPPNGVNGHSISHIKLESLDTTFAGSPYQYFRDSLHHETCYLTPGKSYKVYMTSGTHAISTLAAWIDWNNDTTFSQSEKLGEFITTSANQIDSISFTVPLNPIYGKLRLRVRSSNSTSINACNSYTSGETIDFTITALNPFYEYNFYPGWEFSSTVNNFIDGIVLNSIDNHNSGGPNGPVYSDFSNLITYITACSSNYLYITGNFSSFNDSVFAYIDYNNNGIFEDNELLGNPGVPAGYNTDSIYFNAPHVAGNFRLRIIYYSNSHISEVEDYSISLLNSISVFPPTAQIGSDLFYSCDNNCFFYGCKGQGIFYDYGCGQPSYRHWSVPGANPSSSTLQNPTFNFVNAGTYNITLIDSNSFGSDTITAQVYISSSVTNINLGNNTIICTGDSLLLSAPAGNPLRDCYSYLWSTGATTREIYVRQSGTYFVTLNSCHHTDCPAYDTIVVNFSPLKYNVTGGGGYCTGGSGSNIGLSDSEPGISYRLYNNGNPVGSPVPGTGNAISFGSQTVAGSYTVIATNTPLSCTISMNSSVNVSAVQPPVIYNVNGGGNYCSAGNGVAVGLDSSDINVSYQLYRNGNSTGVPITGTGNAILFPNQTTAGNYTIIATTNNSSCSSSMTGSVNINIIQSPVVYNITGGGSFCVGGIAPNIGLSDSEPGISYHLYKNSNPVGSPVPGTGIAISFGSQTVAGSYTVIATNTNQSCPLSMNGSVNVSAVQPPVIYNVTGGGSYCSGGNGLSVGLNSSNINVSYQLYRNGNSIGAPITGTGNAILFPNQTNAGNYTIIATTNNSSCSKSMSDSVTINIIPRPVVFIVTGGGNFCGGSAAAAVGLSDSNNGVVYELYKNGTPTGNIITGTDSSIKFSQLTSSGNYTIVASNPSMCKSTMTGSANLNIIPAPTAFTLSGGGNYCSGDPKDSIKLSGSETWVRYQLYVDNNPVGNSLNGNGSMLNYGIQYTPGRYTVIGSNTITSCISTMAGSPDIIINPTPTIYNVSGGGHYCNGGLGVTVGLNNSDTAFQYQLFHNNIPVDLPIHGNGSSLNFGFQLMTGNYTVVAVGIASSCSTGMNDTAIVILDPLPSPRITGVLPDTICIFHSPISLVGVPPGGIFSGDGIINDTLFPMLSGAETVLIYYDYTDPSTGCSDYASTSVSVELCIGIEEYDLPGTISLFPNPADNEIITNFFFKKETDLSIKLINSIGQIIRFIDLNKMSGAYSYTINTSAISDGFYLINFYLNNKVFSKKIIIHHL